MDGQSKICNISASTSLASKKQHSNHNRHENQSVVIHCPKKMHDVIVMYSEYRTVTNYYF